MEPIPDPGGLSLRKTSPPSSAVTRLVSVAPGKGGPGATNPKILCFFAKDFCAFSWERTLPACRELETPSTLEACAPIPSRARLKPRCGRTSLAGRHPPIQGDRESEASLTDPPWGAMSREYEAYGRGARR